MDRDLWLVKFPSVWGVSVLQGSLLVIVIMIDGSEKRNCEGAFWTLEFACLWKVQYFLPFVFDSIFEATGHVVVVGLRRL